MGLVGEIRAEEVAGMPSATAKAGSIWSHIAPARGNMPSCPTAGRACPPAIGSSAKRDAGQHVGMIRPAVVADEEALVLVRLGRLVHLRRGLHRGVHRHVADVVLVQLKFQLLLQRQRMESPRCRKCAVDDLLRHAMIPRVKETDVLAGVAHLLRPGVPMRPARRRNTGRSRPPESSPTAAAKSLTACCWNRCMSCSGAVFRAV